MLDAGAGCVINSVDPNEKPRSVASHLGLHCLLRPVCPTIYGKYGNMRILNTNLKVNFLPVMCFTYIVYFTMETCKTLA